MKRIVKLIGLLSTMAIIFYFSSQPALDSSNTSGGFMKLFYSLYSIFGSLSLNDYIEKYGQIIRKLAHFSEFAVLGFFSYINIKEYYQSNIIYLSILMCVVYAITDEFHQLFVSGRYCAVKDMLIDSLGSITMILICYFVSSKCRKKS